MKTRLLVFVVGVCAATQELLAGGFREDGHMVHVVSTAKEVVESFSCARPDLVIIDRSFPGGDALLLELRTSKDPDLNVAPLLIIDGKAEIGEGAGGPAPALR